MPSILCVDYCCFQVVYEVILTIVSNFSISVISIFISCVFFYLSKQKSIKKNVFEFINKLLEKEKERLLKPNSKVFSMKYL